MSKIAVLFPGQGAQHVGMAVKVCEQYPQAAAMFEQAAEILGYDLLNVCAEGPEEQLNSTAVSQPALFVSALATLEVVKDRQPELLEQCQLAAGLSLGEYTALTFAKCMSFEDGLKVVQVRGEAMQAAADATPSGMVSILLLDEEKVQGICDQASNIGQLQIANYLCPGHLVVSGSKEACEKAITLAEEAGGRPIPLKVAGAFHTSIMDSAREKLAAILGQTTLSQPEIPVISNVDTLSHSEPDEIREILIKQVTQPVLWEKSVRSMMDSGVTQFVEIGPGQVLKGLMKRIERKFPFENFNDSIV